MRESLDNLDNDEQFRFITQEIWKDSDLSSYYSDVARRHSHGFLIKSIEALSLDKLAECVKV